MKERIKRLFSLIFITLLLLKSLPSLSPLLSSAVRNNLLTELQTEAEQEKHKNNSRTIEIESLEDFFVKTHACHGDLYAFLSSTKWMMHVDHSLQWVHIDILTPPPDIA